MAVGLDHRADPKRRRGHASMGGELLFRDRLLEVLVRFLEERVRLFGMLSSHLANAFKKILAPLSELGHARGKERERQDEDATHRELLPYGFSRSSEPSRIADRIRAINLP